MKTLHSRPHLLSRLALLAALLCSGTAIAQTRYHVEELDSLGGNNSRGNSINDFGIASGYSTVADNSVRHATAWLFGHKFDLGTLGDPRTSNSTVPWPVKNLGGLIVGISQTDIDDPNGELWSCFYFFGGPHANNGKACRGFAWERGRMRQLLPLPGGTHSFAAGANNIGEIVGWAENAVVDDTCVAPQKLQFKPVVWGPGRWAARALPLVGDDTSGAATAINDRGQIVGISGICDIAVGRYSAAHAVLWDDGRAIALEGFDAPYWNTPNAINRRGDIVGFMGTPGDIDGNLLRAFIRIHGSDIVQQISPLQGDAYATAQSINESRQVVGTSCKEGAVDCRAFLWENGVTHDISRQPGYDGVLTSAQDINNFGVITGRAVDAAGVRKAFVAVPAR
jgi:probable HAF family extracellular repeat protein